MHGSTRHRLAALVLIACFSVPPTLGAQAAVESLPCHRTPCRFSFEGDVRIIPNDRRYGSPNDFELRLRSGLLAHGINIELDGTGDLRIELRPKINTRTICDEMPGLNTDRSCSSIAEVEVTFETANRTVKAPPTQLIRNRCQNVGASMTHAQFGLYVAEMIWYVLEGERSSQPRPVVRC